MKVPMNGLLFYEAQVASVFIRTLPEKGLLDLTKLPEKKKKSRSADGTSSKYQVPSTKLPEEKKKSRSADGTPLSRPGLTNTHHSFQQSNHSSHKSSLLILS